MSKTLHLSSLIGDIDKAAGFLRSGKLVAFPTETVYGLGADASNPQAVAAIYTAKGRPSFNPLIAHVADKAMAEREGVFNRNAQILAEAFWPGPLTLVVPVSPHSRVCDLARSGLPSLALRMPAHPVALRLIEKAGCPVVAPSANRSGHVSPTTANHVLQDLEGRIDAVIDGGECPVGVESSILACLNDQTVLLRAGGVLREAIEDALKTSLISAVESGKEERKQGRFQPLAPGMMTSHYAPRAKVRLNISSVEADEAVLLFGSTRPAGYEKASVMINLSETGDLMEAAAHLFAALRELDSCEKTVSIAVMPIPETGLGEAINDRLMRAAANRD